MLVDNDVLQTKNFKHFCPRNNSDEILVYGRVEEKERKRGWKCSGMTEIVVLYRCEVLHHRTAAGGDVNMEKSKRLNCLEAVESTGQMSKKFSVKFKFFTIPLLSPDVGFSSS